MLEFIALLVIIIIVFRVKNSWDEKHPKQCSFCGKMAVSPQKIGNGYICFDCCKVPYGDSEFNLATLINNNQRKKLTVDGLKSYMADIQQLGEMMRDFQPTKISPSGTITVDENLGLFVVNHQQFLDHAHRIQDIKKIKLVMDRNWNDSSSDSVYIEDGHILVELNGYSDKIAIHLPVDLKIIGMKKHIKKVYEDDLKFLEDLTGLKRS